MLSNPSDPPSEKKPSNEAPLLTMALLGLLIFFVSYSPMLTRSIEPYFDDYFFFTPTTNKSLLRYDLNIWMHDFTVTCFNTRSTPEAPVEREGPLYRPLSHGLYRSVYALGRVVFEDPLKGPFLASMLFHLAGTCFLFGLVRSYFGKKVALGGAALYLMHPLTTAVITLRSTSLDSFVHMIILATLFFLPKAKGSTLRWLPVWALTFIAIFTKEFGLFLLPMLVLLMGPTRLRQEWARLLVPCVTATVYLIARNAIVSSTPFLFDAAHTTWIHRVEVPFLLMGAYAQAFLTFGLSNLFFPLNLYYGKGISIPLIKDPTVGYIFPHDIALQGVAALAFGLAIGFWLYKKNKTNFTLYGLLLCVMAPGVFACTWDKAWHNNASLLYMDHQGQLQVALLSVWFGRWTSNFVSKRKFQYTLLGALLVGSVGTLWRVAEVQTPIGYFRSAVDRQCLDTRPYVALSRQYVRHAQRARAQGNPLLYQAFLQKSNSVHLKAIAEGRKLYWLLDPNAPLYPSQPANRPTNQANPPMPSSAPPKNQKAKEGLSRNANHK